MLGSDSIDRRGCFEHVTATVRAAMEVLFFGIRRNG